ncbi:unnamed protein product [Polarella glacialis]|uniref:Uncharacterized protein n=1 Tax=Polarella glacialis TaxID=89957 RepID=A0A813GBI9_POLGL|nr:unnamed protein product [Polarella glacialis]
MSFGSLSVRTWICLSCFYIFCCWFCCCLLLFIYILFHVLHPKQLQEDARSVLDEETVTYSWRRRGPAEAPKESALESNAVAAQQESTCRQPGRPAAEQASGSHVDSVLGSGGSQPQRAGRGVRFVGGESQAPKEAQPVANSSSSSESTGRRAAKSTALVPRGHGSQPTDGGPGAGSGSGGSSSSGSSGFVRCDIGEAMQLRDTRLGPAGGAVSSLPTAPAALSPAVRLVAYDGQPFPQLAAGALSNCFMADLGLLFSSF